MPPSAYNAPTVLESQAARLGVPMRFASICRHDSELHKLGFILGQLFKTLEKVDPKNPGKVAIVPLPGGERPRMAKSLADLESFHQNLHLRAAAVDAMLADAYARFDLEPPKRSYGLVAESDPVVPSPTIADATRAEIIAAEVNEIIAAAKEIVADAFAVPEPTPAAIKPLATVPPPAPAKVAPIRPADAKTGVGKPVIA
jgi:hypothetical protein